MLITQIVIWHADGLLTGAAFTLPCPPPVMARVEPQIVIWHAVAAEDTAASEPAAAPMESDEEPPLLPPQVGQFPCFAQHC